MQKEKIKGNKGITLIALIITIIVMLILVGTSIQIVVNSDLINTAKSAKEQTEAKYEEEKTFGDNITINGKDYSNLNDYMGIIKLVGQSDGNGLKDYKIYGNSVQNGTPSPNSPVEIQSVGDKTKNLLDVFGRTLGTLSDGSNTSIRELEFDKYYVGLTRNNYYYPKYVTSYSINDDSVIINPSAGGYGIAYPVKVKSNTTYSISKGEGGDIGIGFYTINGEYISCINNITSFTTPDNCGIITVVLSPTINIDTTYKFVQLEEGSTATSYEPYGYKIPVKATNKSGESVTTNIYLDEPLRKIGDVSDYIDFETGKVVRNIGKHIYNENDNWQIQSSSYWFESSATSAFYTQIPNNALGNTQGLECLCNLFKYDGTGDGIDKKVPYISGNIGSLVVNFYNTTVSTIEELETYLAQTNLEIIYKLATPDDTEPINLPTIPTYDGKTIIEIGTEIQPSEVIVEF